MWSVIIVCHRFHTSIRSGSDSRLESFKIQTCKSTLIMQLFWLFFQPHFFKTRSRLPPPYHFSPDRLREPTIWRMIFASASVGGGLAITPASTVCFTPSCQWPIFVVQLLFGRISLSLSSWLMLHIHSLTHAHTWELWCTRARTPPSLFSNEPKCLIHIKVTYWVILLICSLSANLETRYVRCKRQSVHVWSRNVSYFLGALLQGQSMNGDQPLSPEYW